MTLSAFPGKPLGLTLLIIVLTALRLNAQSSGTSGGPAGKIPFRVYVEGGVGAGLGDYGQVNLRMEFADHHEFSFGYQNFLRKSRSVPEGYNSGGTLFGTKRPPQDMLDGFGITYGYVHPLASSNGGTLLRMAIRGGVVLGRFSRPGNFQYTPGGLFEPTHVYDDITESSVGIMVQPALICSPGEAFGFSAGLYGAVYKDFFAGGAYVSVLLGRITDRHWRKAKL